MKTSYSDLDIHFQMEGITVRVLHIVFERFTRTIPVHSHGSNCYEIHYIPCGQGKLQSGGIYYDITPNTLFVTGPHIEHAQAPVLEDPMQEYCIYIKIQGGSKSMQSSPVMSFFTENPFWIGQDSQGIHSIMKQIFFELEHRYIGYQNQVQLLLSQLLIHLVRNYEKCPISSTSFRANNLSNSKSFIIEEYFLYEYQSLSLEELADRLKVSPRQAQRLLLEYYGKSFQQKKTESRMSAAAIMLSDSKRSISSIADALGYSSSEHFSSAFRKYYNKPPREFRKLLS